MEKNYDKKNFNLAILVTVITILIAVFQYYQNEKKDELITKANTKIAICNINEILCIKATSNNPVKLKNQFHDIKNKLDNIDLRGINIELSNYILELKRYYVDIETLIENEILTTEEKKKNLSEKIIVFKNLFAKFTLIKNNLENEYEINFNC